MAKRDDGTTRTKSGAPDLSGATTADAMEQRVMAFAEQLGRIVGTFQARAEGWMDREMLKKQIAGVRDGAADLLEQRGRRDEGPATETSRRGGARAGQEA